MLWRRTKVDNTELSGIVGGLQLRDVDDETAHGSGCYETPVSEAIQLVAVEVNALFLLLPPVIGCVLSAVVCAVEINIHNIGVVAQSTGRKTQRPGRSPFYRPHELML